MRKAWLKIKDRWQAETPDIYKRVRNITATLSGMAIAAQTAVSATGIEINPAWTKIFAYTIGIGAAVAAFAQTRKKGEIEDDND